MIIDCHVHAFTDSIAERVIAKLCDTAKIPNYTDGTEKDTRRHLADCGVDYGVMLPIATKLTQQHTINGWAAEVNHGNFISFGTVHPDASDAIEELDRIKSLGLKGVKLHPDYQNTFLFDDKMLPIFRRCAELDLPVTIHMGYDPVSPLVHHATPHDLVYIHEQVPGVKLIGAHMGGVYQWEAVLKYVAGTSDIFLDTAYTAGFIDERLMLEIIRRHGAENILFASDLPWHSPAAELEVIGRLPLTENERELILWENAARLLNLNL